jgi:hypothetical protein
MPDLHQIFSTLVTAASHGRFEAALMETPLASATLRRHPLGFKVARMSIGKVHLRLHLWGGPPAEQPGFKIHDHSFDLKSHVVEGGIRQIIYTVHNDPAGDRSVYQVAYEDGRSILRKTGVVVLLEKNRQDIFPAGTTYFVQAGELHMAEIHECEVAISLVLTNEKGGEPITIGPRDGPIELVAARSLLSDRSLVELGLRAALLL